MFGRGRLGTRLDILQIPHELNRFEHYWFIREHLAVHQFESVVMEISDDLSGTDMLRLDRALAQPLGHTEVTRHEGNTQRVTAFLAGVHHCLVSGASFHVRGHQRAGLFSRWRRIAHVQRAKPKALDNRKTAKFLYRRLNGCMWNGWRWRVDRVAHLKVPRKGEPPRFRLESVTSRAARDVFLIDVHTQTIESVHVLLGLRSLDG